MVVSGSAGKRSWNAPDEVSRVLLLHGLVADEEEDHEDGGDRPGLDRLEDEPLDGVPRRAKDRALPGAGQLGSRSVNLPDMNGFFD